MTEVVVVPLSFVEKKEASRRIIKVNKTIICSLIFSVVDQGSDWAIVVLLIIQKEWVLLTLQLFILLCAARVTAFRCYVQPLRTVRQNEAKEAAERAKIELQKRRELRKQRERAKPEDRSACSAWQHLSEARQADHVGDVIVKDADFSDSDEEFLKTLEEEAKVVKEGKRKWAHTMAHTHPVFVILSLLEVKKFRIGCALATRPKDRCTVDSWVVYANAIFCRAVFCTAPQFFVQMYIFLRRTHNEDISPAEVSIFLLSMVASMLGFAMGLYAYETIQAQTDGLRQFPSIISAFFPLFFFSRSMEMTHRAACFVVFLFFFPALWLSVLVTLVEELLLIRYMYLSFVRITSGWMHSMKPQDPALPKYTPTWTEARNILQRSTFTMYPMYTICHAQRYFEACLPLGPAFPLRSYNWMRLSGSMLKSLLLVLAHCLDCRTACGFMDFNPFCGGLRGFRFATQHAVLAERNCARLTGTTIHADSDVDRVMKLACLLGVMWAPWLLWKVAYLFVYRRANKWHSRYLTSDEMVINMKRAWED